MIKTRSGTFDVKIDPTGRRFKRMTGNWHRRDGGGRTTDNDAHGGIYLYDVHFHCDDNSEPDKTRIPLNVWIREVGGDLDFVPCPIELDTFTSDDLQLLTEAVNVVREELEKYAP